MRFLQPTTWAEALEAKTVHPDAVAIAGGTDVMVAVNFGRLRPAALLDLTRVGELQEWGTEDGVVRLGAGVPYARVITELGDRLPGLAMASRTIGSPQIRNRGTVGGNLATASPAGDAHPALLAADAEVEVASVRGTRTIPISDFYRGVKRSALAADELIAAVRIRPPSGPQQYSKIGTRNAMVIAVAAFGLALHPDRRAVGTGIGSAAPTPRRATAAEDFLAGELASAGLWESRAELPATTAARFGELVASAAAPIDDVRGTAAYRVHALSVMARRTLGWAWTEYRTSKEV
ncbi:FAD binding domain-containing protein [Trujillonella endophytica]|uniref:CO or xanthine dehydrogenase, FAD-binding subunit n=1 Tax=Trujillonella endophytica TaxID=673521 RepID=A0A1H8WR12_9ACTN|nr:FAD binding domain-containing protein [Trujillella endophytica]SEP29933.1 CO or xanthine dehydrogenase, FAD-binding subunit [Trujillella endophytica]